MSEGEAREAGALGPEDEVVEVVLDPDAEKALDAARAEVGALVAKVTGQDDVETAIAGAGQKFLADTDMEAVAGKIQRKAAKRRSNDPKLDEGWVTLRFRITPEQRNVVEAAIDKAVEMAGKDKSGAYKGWGLEMVCADFLAGQGLFIGSRSQT